MTDGRRLIEAAFPIKQVSLDSVHEKNVRHGHISTLHIWPARRPLAACRAALIATLLPDPGNEEERNRILERMAGKVVRKVKKNAGGGGGDEASGEETVGGILHWGRESGPDLEWFRQEIRKAYGGRAPKVLDPFAGGGAIPLEAMRLGCEATAIDINPVAWFILKCTLQYPQQLAGKKWPLPDFVLENPELMASIFKGQANGSNKQGELLTAPEGDLAAHVRAWGWWVLQRARADLEKYYPTIDGRPTVAYLWARTVTCKNCRATIPLLKTLWLRRKEGKRAKLRLDPKADRTRVTFAIEYDVPVVGRTAAERQAHDRQIGQGTMSRSGATCPMCGAIMSMEDLRQEGRAGRFGPPVLTSVVANGESGKEYRLPCEADLRAVQLADWDLSTIYEQVPDGLPKALLPSKEAPGIRIPQYGFRHWYDIFAPRQLVSIGVVLRYIRRVVSELAGRRYASLLMESITAYLACSLSKVADRASTLCTWTVNWDIIGHTFVRFAFPMTWDYAESVPINDSTGGVAGAIDWITRYIEHAVHAAEACPVASVKMGSATRLKSAVQYDIVVTDPPYYDAIPYSDLMDFFYIWLRRTFSGLGNELEAAFAPELGPKWNHEANDGELVDDSSRFAGDRNLSKAVYEHGMYQAFVSCHSALKEDGLFVVVFAHKNPDAWETLVSAMIRAGFVVEASWPIQTEMSNRTRALSSAALSSSIWLVCRKRPESARPGWDNRVLQEMRENLEGRQGSDGGGATTRSRLHEFWDAGIRGPDFVWAATGPALEAYSRYPVVKKANSPGETMSVSEFLSSVRRMVVDFVVGRVLSRNGDVGGAGSLDDVTAYYLLHRHDFKMNEIPAGACILYAISCGLSDSALADQYDILVRTGGSVAEEEETGDETEEEDADERRGSGSKVRLRSWEQRKRKGMGYETAVGRPVPLIDQIHRTMHLWKSSDVNEVEEYLASRGIRENALARQVLQALIEMAPVASQERSILESISNHLGGKPASSRTRQEGKQGRLM